MSFFKALSADYRPPHSNRLKLSALDVVEIRRLYHYQGWTQQALATEYGVSQPQISKIVNKIQWKDPVDE